jgi:hypothetical protein
MSGLAVVLNTGDDVLVLLYSLLSCAWIVMDVAMSRAIINMVFFIRFSVLCWRCRNSWF